MTTLRFAETSLGDLRASLSNQGYARIGRLLTNEQCKALRESYADPKLFRSRIEMSRFGFGRGEYKYFAKPLPDLVAQLREHLYLALREVANEWIVLLSKDFEFPAKLIDFLEPCESQGQKRPTPLLLRYQAGDYNCLHQDLYGAIFFPFQVICNLSAAGQDFIGGESTKQQSRPNRMDCVPAGAVVREALHSVTASQELYGTFASTSRIPKNQDILCRVLPIAPK
jgi:hypothetical protein